MHSENKTSIIFFRFDCFILLILQILQLWGFLEEAEESKKSY